MNERFWRQRFSLAHEEIRACPLFISAKQVTSQWKLIVNELDKSDAEVETKI